MKPQAQRNVAQVFNLPYRGFATRWMSRRLAGCKPAIQQLAKLRYACLRTVAQVSQPAVSPVSNRQGVKHSSVGRMEIRDMNGKERGQPCPREGGGVITQEIISVSKLADKAVRAPLGLGNTPSRCAQRGVALVITLIMLSVITFLTIAFLAISRRDRASVTTSINQTDARLMADAALARFQTELVSGMMARNDLMSYDLMLTRNYINPAGFNFNITTNDTNNVNYDFRTDNSPLTVPDQIRNIANLFFDPRPPVFVRTNTGLPALFDFRFYLDYNRNGRFETNGLVALQNDLGQPVRDGSGAIISNLFFGEPEWIGVLQHPELPHGPDNKFIGRYLYLALPIGKTLDLNYFHNYAKGNINLPAGMNMGDGFLRNQGFGSWELNLGAFLVDLNTNMYPQNPGVLYRYYPDVSAPTANTGTAFDDAVSFLGYRYGRNFNNLSSVGNLFGGVGQFAFQTDFIDGYSTRPVLTTPFVNVLDPDFKPNDLTGLPWSGSDNKNFFSNPQELFDNTNSPANFVNQLQLVSAKTNSHDRYTFSRLLEQLGMSSAPEVKGKININYTNDPALNTVSTTFVPWTPIQFFTNVADRLFKDNLVTLVVSPGVTNFYMFNTNAGNLVRAGFSYTNIQIYPTNEYTAPVHRLLQLAANIYDATTTNRFPTIFRPQFLGFPGRTFITNYVVETNSAFIGVLTNSPIQERTNVTVPNGFVWGVPLVVSAKKGFPNFNKFVLQTSAQVSRNLQLLRKDTNSLPTTTNQMLVVGISNLFGLEAWNSYTNIYPGNLRIIVTNSFTIALTNELRNIIWPSNGRPTNYGVAANITTNMWAPAPYMNSFLLPLGTRYFNFLTNSQYSAVTKTFRPGITNFESKVDYPDYIWGITMTNKLICMIIDITDPGNQRVVDFVNLDEMTTGIELTKELLGQDYASPPTLGASLSPVERVWKTNRIDGSTSVSVPTEGMRQQILFSMDAPKLPDADWTSYSPSTPVGPQRERAVDNFRKFMGLSRLYSLNQTMIPALDVQTPFNPTRKLDQTATWQVNDPLVHYAVRDLLDTTNAIVNTVRIPPDGPPPTNHLMQLSVRYRPWGGNHPPTKFGQSDFSEPDAEAYDLTVKDPLVRQSDDWDFPTNKFPNIGWLGRVHRGTPWQTIYLKAAVTTNWYNWAGHNESHPTNDWRLMDVFTASANDNAARGLLSVNQTNQAAWSAALGGLIALSNSIAKPNAGSTPQFQSVVIQPNSPQLFEIVNNLNSIRTNQPNQVFHSIGDILAAPQLSMMVDTNGASGSRYLNFSQDQISYGLTDEAVERIPRQLLSLLKLGEPRFVIYCYGQSLRPANNSLVLSPPLGSGLFNLCTNYQITGEVLTRTVLHVEGTPQNPRAVIESYNVLPTD